MKDKVVSVFKKIKKNITYQDIIIFLFVMIPFCLTLFVFFPGILSYDSYYQLSQIETGLFTNWHPFFHTFIELLCLRIWNSSASIAFFQILVYSIIWVAICKYNRKNKNSFKYQVLITLLLAINPLNGIYAITLWKDILFCYSILLVSFLIQIVVDRNYELNFKFIIILSISLAILSQVRYNGLYIAIVLLIVLSILFFKKDRKSKNYIKLTVITMIIILAINSLNIIYNVEDNEKSATDSKVMQLIAYYLKEDRVSDSDRNIISKFVDPKKLEEAYNPYFSDPIYTVINGTDINKYKSDIYKMLIKYSMKNPDLLFTYTFQSTSIVWRIDKPDDSIGTIINTDINSVNNVNNITPKNNNTEYYKNINQFIQKTLNNEFISIILYSPALYLYMTIIAVGIILIIMKASKKVLMVLLPNILNIIIVALSIPVQDVRYVYANFLIFYFVIIILIKELNINKNKKKDLR